MEDVILYISLLLVSGVVCQEVITKRPVNLAVLATQEVVLGCGAPDTYSPGDISTIWTEYISGTGSGRTISLDDEIKHPNSSHYTVVRATSGGTHYNNLTIPSTVLYDGGQYECETLLPDRNQALAEVIVLGSNLQCTDDRPAELMEGETVTFTCEVPYQGLWGPTLQWLNSEDSRAIQQQEHKSTDALVTDTFNLVVNKNDQAKTFDCTAGFGDPPEGVIPPDELTRWYARNTPDYDGFCSSLELDVLYPPEDLQITPKQTNFIPGDTIDCNAAGNPAIEYRWEDIQTGSIVSNTKYLDIIAEMEGEQQFQCVVWNTIRGEERNASESISITVTIPTTTDPPTTEPSTAPSTEPGGGDGDGTTAPVPPGGGGLSDGAIAGIVIGCLLVLIIILVILILCVCRKSPTKSSGKPIKPTGKPAHGVDNIRRPDNNSYPPPGKPEVSYIETKPPPPYDMNPNRNSEGLMYADLALDDTPRSRKPIQVYDPTDYSDIRRV